MNTTNGLYKNEWFLKAIPQTAFKKCRVPEKTLNLARTEEIWQERELKKKKKKAFKGDYFSFIFISKWWANFEFTSCGSVSSAIRYGTQVIGWTRPWRSTISTIYFGSIATKMEEKKREN